MKRWIYTVFLWLAVFNVHGQKYEYEVRLEPLQVEGLGGLQSYAVGMHEGEWLIIGGRLDGLHQRQPFASFDPDGNNNELIVVNPETQEVWKKDLDELAVGVREQFSSTNMQFYQKDKTLILTGGYGYSPSIGDHVTYPFLTTVDVPAAIDAIKSNGDVETFIQQSENEIFRVAGGRLNEIDEAFYLVGGHKFMGRYNPMGPNHGPGFVQEYTNEIRRFRLKIEDEIVIEELAHFHDEMHLHRRDYNLVPFMHSGEKALMLYSGVFKNNADLPWLYPIQITESNYQAIEDFTQYFNHYHCATLPIYDAASDEMHTLFFGGIAQFYMEGNLLVQDNDVPFVNTITDISMTGEGAMHEKVLESSMPGLLGAGSEFIFKHDVELVGEDILSGDDIKNEFVDVGYIYGGIRSSLPNIFWINTGTESAASNTIYKVAIRKKEMVSADESKPIEEKVLFYPSPAQKYVTMSIAMDKPDDIAVEIFTTLGEKVHTKEIHKNEVVRGDNIFVLDNVDIGYGAFLYKVKYGKKTATRKVIWSE